uniref:Uncharacterized protein n=1 Tax=Octopus bimaculoides TaxID=37653 RepID=A0A0L8HJ51_OCTBM
MVIKVLSDITCYFSIWNFPVRQSLKFCELVKEVDLSTMLCVIKEHFVPWFQWACYSLTPQSLCLQCLIPITLAS